MRANLIVRPPLPALSERQRDVLAASARGWSCQEIADWLGVSKATVNEHLGKIHHKWSVPSTRAAIERALGDDCISLEVCEE